MEIKVLTTFISGRFSGAAGDTVTVPAAVGAKLIRLGIAEATPAAGAQAAPETPSTAAIEETSAATRKKAPRARKTPAKG